VKLYFFGLFAVFFAPLFTNCFFAGSAMSLLIGAIISTTFAIRRARVSGFLASSIA
jgi:hypothetical protein